MAHRCQRLLLSCSVWVPPLWKVGQSHLVCFWHGTMGWRLSTTWMGGIYVGRGGGGLPCSVFQEAYYEQLVPGQAKEAPDGRALYVHKGEDEAAYGLISSFVLGREAQPVWNEAVWKKWLEFWLLGGPPRLLQSTSSRRRWSFFRWRFRTRRRTWYG